MQQQQRQRSSLPRDNFRRLVTSVDRTSEARAKGATREQRRKQTAKKKHSERDTVIPKDSQALLLQSSKNIGMVVESLESFEYLDKERNPRKWLSENDQK